MTSRRPYWFSKLNNETATMLLFQTNPVGVELFSYVNVFFCSNKCASKAGHVNETLYTIFFFFFAEFV